jgi:hypothetical protein
MQRTLRAALFSCFWLLGLASTVLATDGTLFYANASKNVFYRYSFDDGTGFSNRSYVGNVTNTNSTLRSFTVGSTPLYSVIALTTTDSGGDLENTIINSSTGAIIATSRPATNTGGGTLIFWNETQNTTFIYERQEVGTNKIFYYQKGTGTTIGSSTAYTFNASESNGDSRHFRSKRINSSNAYMTFHHHNGKGYFLLWDRVRNNATKTFSFYQEVYNGGGADNFALDLAVSKDGNKAYVFYLNGTDDNITYRVYSRSSGSMSGPYYVQRSSGYTTGNFKSVFGCVYPANDSRAGIIYANQNNDVGVQVVKFTGGNLSGAPTYDATAYLDSTDVTNNFGCFPDYTNNEIVFYYVNTTNKTTYFRYNGSWSVSSIASGLVVQPANGSIGNMKHFQSDDGTAVMLSGVNSGNRIFSGTTYNFSSKTFNTANAEIVSYTSTNDYNPYAYVFKTIGTSEEEPVDSCTCPGTGNNWEVDLSDSCVLSTACSAANLSFTNTGSFTINASLNITGIDSPITNQVVYIGSAARVLIG